MKSQIINELKLLESRITKEKPHPYREDVKVFSIMGNKISYYFDRAQIDFKRSNQRSYFTFKSHENLINFIKQLKLNLPTDISEVISIAKSVDGEVNVVYQ